jgi:hypothetical protein
MRDQLTTAQCNSARIARLACCLTDGQIKAASASLHDRQPFQEVTTFFIANDEKKKKKKKKNIKPEKATRRG